MANIQSAKKKVRKDIRRTKLNDTYRKRVVASVRSLKKATEKEAEGLVPKVQSAIDKATKRNIIHKNKAARMKSRLMKKV